jgi:hypothetical protein
VGRRFWRDLIYLNPLYPSWVYPERAGSQLGKWLVQRSWGRNTQRHRVRLFSSALVTHYRASGGQCVLTIAEAQDQAGVSRENEGSLYPLH